jgi:hypothetical protein
MRILIDEIHQPAKGGSVDDHGGMFGIDNNSVLIIISVRRLISSEQILLNLQNGA